MRADRGSVDIEEGATGDAGFRITKHYEEGRHKGRRRTRIEAHEFYGLFKEEGEFLR